jgi:hypothetical protein
MAGSLEDMTVDQLLAHAKSLQGQASLLTSLTSNPETRETIQRALKKVNPKLSIPEIDAKDAVREEIKAEREERLKLERQLMEREARDNVKERRAAIKAKYSLSDADVEKVEALILDHKEENWSHDTGAAVFAASRESAKPTPATFVPPTYQLMEGKDDPWAGGLMSNAPGGGGTRARLDRIGMNEAYKAMNELFGGKVPGLGSAKAN